MQKDLESSYQLIQKAGIDKILQLMLTKLETFKKPHIDSFVSYLVSNVADIHKNDQVFQEILDNLNLSSKFLNQVLNVWEEFRVNLKEKQDQITLIQMKKNNNYQHERNQMEKKERIDTQIPEFLIKNLKESLNQISEKDWTQESKDILQVLINYIKTKIEQDQQIQEDQILKIIEDFELSRQNEKIAMTEIKKYISEYTKIYESKKSAIKIQSLLHLLNEKTTSVQKEQRNSKEIKLEMQNKQSRVKKDKSLSQIYTLIYQQQDHCLDLVSLKVICDFQKIQELISQLQQNEVKTVGLYGNFKLAFKIIQNYYHQAKNLINLDSYVPPDNDKLIALTDGSIIFLIFQEQKSAFEGDIYDNEEGQLFIRFLLDSCSIFITCLDEKQVSRWSNSNPFEQFEAIVPPKQYKDRSSIFLKQITINSNIKIKDNILLTSDQSNCMIMNGYSKSSIIDNNKLQIYLKQINQNKDYINNLFKSTKLYNYIEFDKINENKQLILNIFSKHTEYYNQIEQIYTDFKNQVIKLQESLQENSFIENLLFEQKYQLKQSNEAQIKPNQINFLFQRNVCENQKNKQGQDIGQVKDIKSEKKQILRNYKNHQQSQTQNNFVNLQETLQNLICTQCKLDISCQKKRKYGCEKCQAYKNMVDQIHQNVENVRSFMKNWVYGFFQQDLYAIIQSISKDVEYKKEQINFNSFSNYLNYQTFYTHFKDALNEVLNNLCISFEEYSFEQKAIIKILNFIIFTTYELIKKIVIERQAINDKIVQQKDIFLIQIDQCFNRLLAVKEERVFVQPFQFAYDPIKKEEVLLSINYKIQNIILSDQAHKLVDYISFDEQVDYLVYNNQNIQEKIKQKTFIYLLRKNKSINDLQYVFQVSGSIDVSLFINQYSRQWVIFANDTRKNSIGKINSDYSFEEGRIDINVYETQTQNGNTIEKVDSCIILNEKNNVVILYEKKKKQFYEFFLSGQLKEIKFDLSRELFNNGVVQIQNIPQKEIGYIQSVKNSREGDFYVFQTDKFLYLTNPNYIVKQEISLKQNFSCFKLITTDSSILLITLYKNNYECYVIQGIEESEEPLIMSSLSDEKAKVGNIVIDKMIKSMVHYGSNSTQIGCPALVHQLFFYEKNQVDKTQNFEKCIEKYFSDCLVYKDISFNITHTYKNCFNNIDLLLNKLDSILQAVEPFSSSDLQFILQTRIPLQLTTIQQSNYLPLKDGLFKQDLMNVPEVEDQIEQIKKQISFGWIENVVQLQNKEMYIIATGGRQSVGKSSLLNRLFGTRFGVSASRCTDGIWIGLSKLEDRLILVMDCEGLFSIRRTDDEEVKLLLQITSISDITMVYCDIDGVSKPLLSLFKQLQICAGKMQSDSFFLGTMALLTKNVQDEGDKKKLLQLSQIYLNKKEIKHAISKIFKGGLSYGFLKSYQSQNYNSNLQRVRDDLLYKEILLKKSPKKPLFLMNILKYSMIQIYLNDDQDIDMISKQSEIKEEYNYFTDLFFDISNQKFIKSEKLLLQFEYKPISAEEKSLINFNSVFKYGLIFNQNSQNKYPQLIDHKNQDVINAIYQQINLNKKEPPKNKDIILDEQEGINLLIQEEEKFIDLDQSTQHNPDQLREQEIKNKKSYNILELSQCDLKLYPQQSNIAFLDKKSQNCEYLESVFFNCFRVLQRANFNNYVQQKQNFYTLFIKQRRDTIKEYFNNRMPKEPKYRELLLKFEQKFDTVIHSLDKQLTICRQKCNKCNRACVSTQGHKGNCNCETSHKCYFKCQICKNKNECFLISGHEGTHFCKEMNHLCQKECQMSLSCKELCTLEPHTSDVKHSCQNVHKCEFQCRLYNKCGKTCSLQSGHEETNHLCESTQCYDKCEFCGKLCGFNLHDHDILLSNIQKNQKHLMKNGKLVTKHLCGDYHSCLQKCEKPGVCSITYITEEKIWETKISKFEYQFIKPCKSQKQCSIQIEPWQIVHDGQHQCESTSTHRCDQQCPECLSYCFDYYNHPGNHNSKNHRNKENCVFVSETDQIKINSEQGNTRSYLPGESSTPENCLQSCLRMSRAHIHLRVCKGGNECAEKKYPFARHSTKKYKPFTHLIYDEMLCKGYWNSINWEPPADQENLQIIQSCNTGCSHESHEKNPNYCIKQAWHRGPHQIDLQKCEHLGTGIVDICFTIDTTGSMKWAMSKLSQTVNDIVDKFQGKANIKYSIVSYRDHPPQDQTYVYKIDSQLTDKDNILKVLSRMRADGGGDGPEAVMDGLFYSITQINWRDSSVRFLFHICDSPPHGKQYGISSSDPSWTNNGCPCGINEYHVAKQISSKKIFYYLVKVNSSLNMMENTFSILFGQNFKQTIDLSDTNKLNVEIVQALSKEINTTNEFYHVNENKKI